MLEKSKKTRVMVSSVLVLIALIFDFNNIFPNVSLIMYLISWIVAGVDILYQAVINLKNKMLMAEHFLMSLATIGAIFIQEYREAALVMVLFQIGELLQDRAVDKSRDSIAELMDIQAPIAYRLVGNKSESIDPDEIEIGDLIEIKPGEKIPVDGKITSGNSLLDVSPLTGESMPKKVNVGDEVLSGSINKDGYFVIEATKISSDSTAMRIIELVEEATENQAETENLITRFAKIYTPIVVTLAIIISLVPPLFFGEVFIEWLRRGLTFLVISCPCAFVISVPMSFVLGIGASSKMGILVKGGNIFEKLIDVDTLVVDKTGTITEGNFEVVNDHPHGDVLNKELLSRTYLMEEKSNHPIADAIKRYSNGKEIIDFEFSNIENVPGRGLKGTMGDEEYILGNLKYMEDYGLLYEASEDRCIEKVATMVHVARIKPDKKYIGHYVIEDVIKPNAKYVVSELHNKGIKKIIMLTGDSQRVAKEVSDKVGIDEYKASLLPDEKLKAVEELSKNSKKKIAYVGDGLNDAPVLKVSDVGIAMGGIGSDAAIEASDVVLVNDDLDSILRLFETAKRTVNNAYQNIGISLGVKILFLTFAAFGKVPMWLAVFADGGVALVAIINAFRLYFIPKKLMEKYR